MPQSFLRGSGSEPRPFTRAFLVWGAKQLAGATGILGMNPGILLEETTSWMVYGGHSNSFPTEHQQEKAPGNMRAFALKKGSCGRSEPRLWMFVHMTCFAKGDRGFRGFGHSATWQASKHVAARGFREPQGGEGRGRGPRHAPKVGWVRVANGCSSTPKWLAIDYATHGHMGHWAKSKQQGTAGFSPWFLLPGQPILGTYS